MIGWHASAEQSGCGYRLVEDLQDQVSLIGFGWDGGGKCEIEKFSLPDRTQVPFALDAPCAGLVQPHFGLLTHDCLVLSVCGCSQNRENLFANKISLGDRGQKFLGADLDLELSG